MELLLSSSTTPVFHLSSFFTNQTTLKSRPAIPFTLLTGKLRLEALSCTMSGSSQTETKPKEAKLWGGRFEKSVTDIVENFTESISFDKQLYKHDIMGSKAHASMLASQGLISSSDRDSILQGLNEIERCIEAGEFVWRTDREDVHMNIEAALTDMIGEPAKKLHTARSRNDQVLTDFRLWCRDAIDRIIASIRHLQVALVSLALRNKCLIIPGYTHLQRAQPVLLQHLLLAYVEQLERDAGRLIDCRARLNFCPLGACALAGTGLPIDRFITSKELGFTAPLRNSIDAVSDRDFVLEFLFANSIIAIHLSWLGEEWVMWASEEFGFITPSNSVSAGSSIIPQKKNPDPMELVRGKSARVIGDLITLLTLCKGLPLAYNRDLQEDKEPMFDSVKTVVGMLEVSLEFAQDITINQDRIQKALPAGYLDATTLADYLVKKELISISDRDSALKGLDEIERRIEAGEFVWRTDREDVRKNIEAALIEMIGEPAKKLHTGRSQNDQVLTDFYLWCCEAIDRIIASIKHLQVALVSLALRNEGLIIPGYTHLQRAQPVLLQHLLLAYVEQLERDVGRLIDCRARLNFCPLGACELVGTSLSIDRFMTSDELVSDQDFVLEFLSANSIIAIHLSRLGEEWVMWASEEFGFITPSDSVSTGSSIMPQKKNPDPMELVRGKSARVIGDLVTLLTLWKGLPLAYNLDLQEVKEPMLDSVKTVVGMLAVSAEFAQNITFNQDRIQKALPAGYLDATTLADYLVKKGIPFRTSHDIVGRSVALCVSKNCQLQDLSLDELKSLNPVFEDDVYEYLGIENSVKKFCSYGSTGSKCVADQLAYWTTKLEIRRP